MKSNLPNDLKGSQDTCINTKSISWDHRNSDQDRMAIRLHRSQ